MNTDAVIASKIVNALDGKREMIYVPLSKHDSASLMYVLAAIDLGKAKGFSLGDGYVEKLRELAKERQEAVGGGKHFPDWEYYCSPGCILTLARRVGFVRLRVHFEERIAEAIAAGNFVYAENVTRDADFQLHRYCQEFEERVLRPAPLQPDPFGPAER